MKLEASDSVCWRTGCGRGCAAVDMYTDYRMNFLKEKTRSSVHLSVAVTVVMCIVSRLITFYVDGGAVYRAVALLQLSCSLYGHTK